MGWKKLILGEKMPDKDDPKYAERREKELEAGRKTCRWLKLDKAAYAIQSFASARPKVFLALVFGVVLFCFSYNVYCLARFANVHQPRQTATQAVERRLETARPKMPVQDLAGKVTNQNESEDAETTETD